VMDINLSLEGKDVVLIDDVLFTGRSIRSAIDALMAFGRPKSVELLTLINRRFSRHLPIQPNYVGKTIDVMESEKIIVEWEENTGIDRVLIRQLK
jgi:pyrimidine operon attenuation protein / uracil phosphoribosyltransferase